MAVIKRGIGFTATEQKLAKFADKIFLNLWTYPNLFKHDANRGEFAMSALPPKADIAERNLDVR